jgi:ABC-type transporter Mla subunit MlaD
VASLGVYAPLAVRLMRLRSVERKLSDVVREALDSRKRGKAQDARVDPEPIRALLADSAIAATWNEFEQRWSTARLSEAPERAPIRLADVLDDRPLFPFGPRRSLLPILPSLFIAIGVVGALLELIPSLSGLAADDAPQAAQVSWIAAQIAVAMRSVTWGFLFAASAMLAGRLIEGSFAARSSGLDSLIEQAFGSVSPGELAEITRQTQQSSIQTLGRELGQFSNELNERLDRGLQRIEQSSVRSATLISQEQRSALNNIVQEISLTMRQGVEHQLAELREVLQRAIEHQHSVANGLTEAFDTLVANTKSQDRVARSLNDSAGAVDAAARSMRSSADEMQPLLSQLGTTSSALADTAGHIRETQQLVARSAEGVRSSLEFAASGAEDQRASLEHALSEMRRTLLGLGDGLSDTLKHSVREVDQTIGATIGQLRETLAETNETVDRLGAPIRATEGATRETQVALDRVRAEVEALGQWLGQAAKPLRAGLEDVEGRAGDIARAIAEFANHTRQIDKTMQALRDEIHEESRRIQGAGGDLGRRLTQAAAAVGILETATIEATRRTRAGTGNTGNTASPAALAQPQLPAAGQAAAAPPAPTSTHWRSPRPDPPVAPADASSSPMTHRIETASNVGRPEGAGPTPTARAQGPDPYARFEGDAATPTTDAPQPGNAHYEHNGELKLSNLLGASDPAPRHTPAGTGDGAEPSDET